MDRPGRPIGRAARRWLEDAAVHLFPSRCFVCRRSLPRLQHLGACATCWAALVPTKPPWCRRCALPLPPTAHLDGPATGCCVRCALRPLPLDEIVAAVRYDVRARPFLLRAKDYRRPELLAPLGSQLAAAVTAAGFVERVDTLVPVPSSKLARLRRGFDPAAKLAVQVALLTGLPIGRSLLERRSFAGPPAKGLGAAARWKAAERSVVASENAVALSILLIDDVLTTGATAAACALALREAGAREVRAAVWARTPAPFGHL